VRALRRRPLALVLGLAAAAAVAAVIVTLTAGGTGNRRADGLEPGSPVRARASLFPRGSLFGDSLTARVDIVLDRRVVDAATVRVDGRFSPYRPAGRSELARENAGKVIFLRYTQQLRCLRSACRPRDSGARIQLPPAAVTFSLRGPSGGRGSLAVRWPAVNVFSRLDPTDPDTLNANREAPWRADVISLPALTYSISPGPAAGLLFAAVALLIVVALALLAPFLPRRERAPRPQPAPTAPPPSPLEQALQVLETDRPGDGAVESRRKALELVGVELGRRGASNLALGARRMAWSEQAPPPEATRTFAQSVRVTIVEGPGDAGE
jgi:hypothetical protein